MEFFFPVLFFLNSNVFFFSGKIFHNYYDFVFLANFENSTHTVLVVSQRMSFRKLTEMFSPKGCRIPPC